MVENVNAVGCEECKCASCSKAHEWDLCKNCIACEAKGDYRYITTNNCPEYHRQKYKKKEPRYW